MPAPRRVVITGIGMVSPLGPDRESTWRRLLAGDCALRSLHPAKETEHLWPRNPAGAPAIASSTTDDELRSMGRDELTPFLKEPVIAHAVAATFEALNDSGLSLDSIPAERTGCVIGTSKGGVCSLSQFKQLAADHADWDFWWYRMAPSGPASVIASLFDLRAACVSPITACATGLSCVVQAVQLIQSGVCDVAIAGSSDASLTPLVSASFRKLGVLAQSDLDPASAVRPFDRNRSGFLIGEGAAVFVLESAEHASQRNACSYAQWLGSGQLSDATGLTQLDANSDSLERLIRDVLQRSQLTARELDYVSLHGTATQTNDLVEMRALNAVLNTDASRLSGSSIKGAIGHLLGAAGSVEFATTLLAMRDDHLPPTLNLKDPIDECRIDPIPSKAKNHSMRHAMKLSLGFGGHLVAAVVKRPDTKCKTSPAS